MLSLVISKFSCEQRNQKRSSKKASCWVNGFSFIKCDDTQACVRERSRTGRLRKLAIRFSRHEETQACVSSLRQGSQTAIHQAPGRQDCRLDQRQGQGTVQRPGQESGYGSLGKTTR